MRDYPYHIGAFRTYGLCRATAPAGLTEVEKRHWDGGGYFFNGQWREVMKNGYLIDCEQCKLVVLVMRGNGLIPLFDSNQRELALTIERLLK